MIVPDSEYLDFSQVPQSKGVPRTIVYAIVVGLVMIFIIGGSVILLAGTGHRWPANMTMRVPLGNLRE